MLSHLGTQAVRVRIAMSLAGIGALPCLLTGCGSGSPSLAAPGLNGGEAGYSRVRLGQSVSIGFEGTVCLDQAGEVTVTGITPIEPHGLRVIGFALRPNENWRPTPSPLGSAFLGMDRRSLATLGFIGRKVDAVCHPKTGSGYEPGVRVVKTTTGTATSAGWMIWYTSHGHSGTFQWPLAIDLCTGGPC